MVGGGDQGYFVGLLFGVRVEVGEDMAEEVMCCAHTGEVAAENHDVVHCECESGKRLWGKLKSRGGIVAQSDVRSQENLRAEGG